MVGRGQGLVKAIDGMFGDTMAGDRNGRVLLEACETDARRTYVVGEIRTVGGMFGSGRVVNHRHIQL